MKLSKTRLADMLQIGLNAGYQVEQAHASDLVAFTNEAERFFSLRKYKWKRKHSSQRITESSYNALGWTLLGSGYHGEAWSHHAWPELVLKISGRQGWGYENLHRKHNSLGSRFDGWPAYAEFCTKVSGRYFPKIHSLTKHSEGMHWAVMPKYRSWDEVGFGVTSRAYSVRSSLEGSRDSYPKWFKGAVMYASQKLGSVSMDVHCGNIMFDANNRAVITDPFCTGLFSS